MKKVELAMQHAIKKYGNVVKISQGHANTAWEEYQSDALEYEGLETSILVSTASTPEVVQVLKQEYPNARIWEGVWQGHVISPSEDISLVQAKEVMASHTWKPYRFVVSPRKVAFWHDSYKKYELCEPRELPKLWVDVISPRLEGNDATEYAFTSVFYDGSELGHSAHVCRHIYMGTDSGFAYFKQSDSHESIPAVAVKVGHDQCQQLPQNIKKVHKCLLKSLCFGDVFKIEEER